MAVTEMVPDLTRAPYFFGPREIWSTRNVGPIKCHSIMIFMWEPNLYGTKFLGDKISWGQNFLGPNKFRGPIYIYPL